MKSITVKLFSVNKLKKHFDKKIFAVPQLQREFVWNIRKACDLLDSIYNNYPVGTILIWDSHRNSLSEFRQDYISLPLFDNIHNKRIYLIIDGQQRLSVLYHCFIGDLIENSFYKEVDFSKIYFNLNHKENDKNNNSSRFKFTKHPDVKTDIKVSDLLSSSWGNKFKKYSKAKKSMIKNCREKLLNYKFPLIFINTHDMAEIEKSFIRINSAGTPLSSADRAIALATNIDLLHNINGVRAQLNHGFKKIGRLGLIMTISLIWGSNQVGKKGIESVINKIKNDEEEIENFNKIWLSLRNSYALATDFLVHNLGVINFDFLPSQNMLTVLTALFYYNKNKQPSPIQKEQIKKWFWYTGIGSRYSGRGYSKNIVDDFNFFKKLGEGKHVKFRLTEMVSINDIKTADYSKKGSLSNAYLCLLALNKPKYLQGGGEIPLNEISSRSNKKNKHHIFPRQHLINKGFNKRYYNSIANICFLVWKENIEFGFRAPRVYLEDYKHRSYFPGVMRSHYIPHKKSDGLWDSDSKKGFKKFLDIRAKLICNRFQKVAGVKMFEKF